MCSYVSIMATFSYEYKKVSNFSLCLLSFLCFFWCYCWILIETEEESDREGERACVKVLTAIKAVRWCWYKYLTLRGNLQHVMSRPWLGWTVTPSHITWFHVGEWRGGGHVSALHRLRIREWTMLPLTLISIKPFLWNSVPPGLDSLPAYSRSPGGAESLQNKLPQRMHDQACSKCVYVCVCVGYSTWHQTS